MTETLWLLAAALFALLGMGWLALSLETHWKQVHPVPRSGRWATGLRTGGASFLLLSGWAALHADHPSMAVLVWIMLLAAAAVAVAIILSGAPRVLRGICPVSGNRRRWLAVPVLAVLSVGTAAMVQPAPERTMPREIDTSADVAIALAPPGGAAVRARNHDSANKAEPITHPQPEHKGEPMRPSRTEPEEPTSATEPEIAPEAPTAISGAHVGASETDMAKGDHTADGDRPETKLRPAREAAVPSPPNYVGPLMHPWPYFPPPPLTTPPFPPYGPPPGFPGRYGFP